MTWTRPILDDELQVGWEARVEARTRAGEVVGAAEAQCLRAERTWKGRDDYALRSMAQTRAVSKALRLPLGFVMQLAGFNPTPAEEMAVIESSPREPSGAAAPSPTSGPPAGSSASLGDVPFGDDYDAPIIPAGADAHLYITEKQRTRLFTIASNAGVDEDAVRDVVREFTGQESTKLIKKGSEYDGIIASVQAKGA